MYSVHFIMRSKEEIIRDWTPVRNVFQSREMAMDFAQTVAKGLANSGYTIFYRIERV